MTRSLIASLSVVAMLALAMPAQRAHAVTYAVDIDSTNGGPIDTASGFTSLDATEPSNGDSVVIDGVTFSVFSADGSRLRSASNGADALTRDFIFDDGSNAAVGVRVFDLPEGIYDVRVWSFDASFPTAVGDQIVGITRFGAGPEAIFTTSFSPNPTDPFVFRIDSADFPDGFGIFTRENNGSNRARFNAVTLQAIPEPASAALLMLGVGAVAARRRRTA